MSLDSTALGTEAQQVFVAAMKLPEIERAKLADKLSLTLDPTADPEWQAVWEPEIARRVAEIENGTAKLVDCEDFRRELWEGLDVARDPEENCCPEDSDWETLNAEAQPLFDTALRLTDEDRAKLADRLYTSVEHESNPDDVLEATIARRGRRG